ncbi:MAG: alanine--tRNA ligase [Candidatus Binataceae bacterium]
MRWTAAKVRQSFLDFFAERGHAIVPSAPLVPKGDPTLLFTNAGMVPFKDYFLGIRTAPSARVVDCQKCLRISGKHNDLEAVGRDTYHHTFFEMLGNWSFGDYYKKEAIEWHWELITKVWGVDPKLLWATVHKDDREAEDIWLKLGVLPRERILRFGDKDNFWEMGETGPCGPNSEIDLDRGAGACNGEAHRGVPCAVNVDGCERFIEIGNLVFIQYNRDSAGALTPLPMKHVDTGTGLERVAAALQSIEAGKLLGNYDIDVFQTIIGKIEHFVRLHGEQIRLSDSPLARKFPGIVLYGHNDEADISYRAIADHSRAITFLIADEVVPENIGRGYVLRRLIRRAVRHGRRLGIIGWFLSDVCVNGVIPAFENAYPELQRAKDKIVAEVHAEEQRFFETFDRGLDVLNSWRKVFRSGAVLPGETAFKLYDTYGFPLDLTQDILREDEIAVDVAGFDRLMDEQRERGRAARKDEASAPEIALGAGTSSQFIGHHRYEAESEVVASGGADGNVTIVVAETPFYPEGGGQVGDRGAVETESGALIEVTDTRKQDGAIVHIGRIVNGTAGDFAPGKRVKLKVDRPRRDAAMLNHSATHILHYALREALGKSVHQAGSLVEPGHLRFDFSHQGPVKEGALLKIEEEVNARIREDAEVTTEEMAYADAIKAGALAFFGDKYGDRVRVVRMGDFSVELCGGTHISRTGEVGFFKLEGESGVAAGVRRIEAVTGQGALLWVREHEKLLDEINSRLGARDSAAVERLEKILAREKELEKKLRALEQKLASGAGATDGAKEEVRMAGGIKIVTRRLEGVEPRTMREIADAMRQKHGSAVVALGSDLGDGKAALLVAVTSDLADRVKAGDIIKQIAPIIGGTGGGRPDLAQAGGKDSSKLGVALARVGELVGEQN